MSEKPYPFLIMLLQLSVAFVIIGATLRFLVPYTTSIIASSVPHLPPGTQSAIIRHGTNTGEVMVILGVASGVIWIVLLGAMHFAPKELGERA